MESLRAKYEQFRRHTERVGDKVMKQALSSGMGSQMRQALTPARQYSIRGRTVVEERQISEGGFAFVWAARDCLTNEELALKKIVCQDREGLAMARREVDILERLPLHPNLVKYYGHMVCDTEGRAKEVVLLFELCPGGHLLHLLERNKGTLKEERILGVMTELCAAVALLHSQSPPIQHRDLKVENVLLGADGSFKLCDFGSWSDERSNPSNLDKQHIAVLQEQIDRYTTMMYRPPEMVDLYQQFTISEKVDIWMLGCILYTLMFCRHPFQDESSLAIANARYHLPSSPRYSERLRDLTHWLLAQDPAHRPSATQLSDVLRNFNDGGILQLPNPVVEKRNQLNRLYGDNPSSSAKSAEPPLMPRRVPKEKQLQKTARQHTRREGKAQVNDFWAQANPTQSGTVDAWPPVSVPEPSRAWATFDFPPDHPQEDVTDNLCSSSPLPAPGRAGSASASQRSSPQSRRGRHAGAPSFGTTECWLDKPVPSAGSRAPPPDDTSHASGLPQAPLPDLQQVLPLALSGRSHHSGWSSASPRSTASVRTERSYHSEPFGSTCGPTIGSSPSPAGRSSPGARRTAPHRKTASQAGQDGFGDYWSLAAAETTSQTWDWPGMAGPPSIPPVDGSRYWSGRTSGLDADGSRSTTPRPRRSVSTGCSGRELVVQPDTTCSPAAHRCSEMTVSAPANHGLSVDGENPVNSSSPEPWCPWASDRIGPQQLDATATPKVIPEAASQGLVHGCPQAPAAPGFAAWPCSSADVAPAEPVPPWSQPALPAPLPEVPQPVAPPSEPGFRVPASAQAQDLLSGSPLADAAERYTQSGEHPCGPWAGPPAAQLPPQHLCGGAALEEEGRPSQHDPFAHWAPK